MNTGKEKVAEMCQFATEAFQYLQNQLPNELERPLVGVICGSGLGGLANAVLPQQPRLEIYYKDIPHFPLSTGMLLTCSRLQ